MNWSCFWELFLGVVMKYEKIRAALAAMPTEGPWYHHRPSGSQHTSGGYVSESEDRHVAEALCQVLGAHRVPALTNGAFIAACNPAAISELLTERDALIEALTALRECIMETRGPDAHSALVLADAALSAYHKQEPTGQIQ